MRYANNFRRILETIEPYNFLFKESEIHLIQTFLKNLNLLQQNTLLRLFIRKRVWFNLGHMEKIAKSREELLEATQGLVNKGILEIDESFLSEN